MKKVIATLALGAVALLASPGHGDGCVYNWATGEYDCPAMSVSGTSELATLQTYKNEIVDHTNQVEFAKKGEGAMAVSATASFGKDIHYVDIVPRYNPTGNLGFDVRFPLIQNGESDEFGIGDISASSNYHFGNLQGDYGFNLTTLRYIAATGDDEKGLGMGEGAVALTHTLVKDITADVRVHGLVNYTMIMGDIDDSMALMAGVSHMGLIPSVAAVNAKFTYFAQDKLSVADLWMELSSTNIVPGVPLSGGLKVPLMDDYDGEELDKAFMLYVSAMGFFN